MVEKKLTQLQKLQQAKASEAKIIKEINEVMAREALAESKRQAAKEAKKKANASRVLNERFTRKKNIQAMVGIVQQAARMMLADRESPAETKLLQDIMAYQVSLSAPIKPASKVKKVEKNETED